MKNRLIILGLLLSVLLAACNFSLAEDITPPPNYVYPTPQPTLGNLVPAEPPSPALGKAIFEVNCAPCHGTDGLGNGSKAGDLPVPVSAIGLRDIASQSNPTKWYTIITQGQMDRYMPPFIGLSDAERWDALAYVYSLSNTTSQVSQGAALYKDLCAICHGTPGDSTSVLAAGVKTNFSDPTFMSQATGLGLYQAIANGSSTDPKMQAFNSQMSESEIWAVTAYLRMASFDMSSAVVAQAATATLEPSKTSVPTANPTQNTTPEAATATLDATSLAAAPTVAATQIAATALTVTPDLTTTPEIVTGTVSGQITNGSGGKIPTDINIVLHGYINMSETINLTTTLKADGTYEFTDVPLQDGIAFIISMQVEGTVYNSDVATYDGTTTAFELPLTVYDVTIDTSSISADRMHIFFDFTNPGVVQVIEIYIISNSSNKAVVSAGAGQAVQTYILPEGATNLQFDSGEIGNPYIQTDNGFGDPTSILPGASSYQMLFAFDMAYGKKLEIKQPLNVAVGSVILMVPDGIKASSDQLTDGGLKDVQGKSYSMYTSSNLAAGDTLTLTISGTASAATTTPVSTSTTQTSVVIGLAILGAVLILAGLFFFLRGRSDRGEQDEEEAGDENDSLGDDSDRLMDAIASLDDQFKAGTLNEAAYKKRRAELKARLKELL
jgi:mono/diheme cytochrome c family protein